MKNELNNGYVKDLENVGIVKGLEKDKEEYYREKIKSMRVNFDDAQSIMNYGTELLNEIAEVLYSISALHNDSEISDFDEYQKKIAKIGNFSQEVEHEVQKGSQLPVKAKKKTFKFINSLFKTDLKVENAKFHDLLEIQLKNINDIEIFFHNMLNEIHNNVEMSQEALREMQPFLDELTILIKVGHEDLQNRKSLISLCQSYNEDQKVIALEHTKVSMFERKLVSLEKGLVSYNQQQVQMNIGIFNKIALATNCQEIIGNTLPLMRAEAYTQIGTVLDRLKVRQQKVLANEVRSAYIENAKMAVQNTKDVVKLSDEGIIDIKTYEKTGNELQAAMKMIYSILNDDRNNDKAREKIHNLIESVKNDMVQLSSYLASFDENANDETTQKSKILEDKYNKIKGNK